jgi:hypothetical protein
MAVGGKPEGKRKKKSIAWIYMYPTRIEMYITSPTANSAGFQNPSAREKKALIECPTDYYMCTRRASISQSGNSTPQLNNHNSQKPNILTGGRTEPQC